MEKRERPRFSGARRQSKNGARLGLPEARGVIAAEQRRFQRLKRGRERVYQTAKAPKKSRRRTVFSAPQRKIRARFQKPRPDKSKVKI
jgi:hypothetical protein